MAICTPTTMIKSGQINDQNELGKTISPKFFKKNTTPIKTRNVPRIIIFNFNYMAARDGFSAKSGPAAKDFIDGGEPTNDCSPAQGWGGRIRTYESRLQRPLPYHLATPQLCTGLFLVVKIMVPYLPASGGPACLPAVALAKAGLPGNRLQLYQKNDNNSI